MWPFTSKRRSRMAVFLHDGSTWHGYVFAPGRPRWRSVARLTTPGQNPRNLPPSLLDFAEKHGARRVRLGLPQNVQTLRAELPSDAEPEELQTAMVFELASETGGEVESIRVAAARAESFGMGASPDCVMAASFEQSALDQYAKACHAAGLRFDGIGALELAVLGAHAEESPDARLLLLRRDAGFYAVPATEHSPMTAGAVALGVHEDERELDAERRERTQRRFALHRALSLSVWCVPMPDEARGEQLRALVGEGADVRLRSFEAAVETVARQFAETAEVGVPAGGGAVVGPRAPEKDPHRAGTWLFFMVLLATIGGLGLYGYTLRTRLTLLEEKTQAWEAITQQRETLEGKLSGLKAERARCEETVELLATKSPLPPGLLALLDALDRAMPEFTRVTSIVQDAKGGFEIQGHTAVQDSLNQLVEGLKSDMEKVGHDVLPRRQGQIEGTTDFEFVYAIGPQGREEP